jgi:hypothetical protein|eukprot:CAMPEP_0168315584 /NCGR_PEP_ID=MMETSP0210-20121227/11824_1 /TAXON_ID=40633 /ORGANISM="Condylostoma magnum, Strain COL2" /LENGTH=37 /DNA_ID= /DNA_START= /DNA_END= /DNA_ORIENTATION=
MKFDHEVQLRVDQLLLITHKEEREREEEYEIPEEYED